MWSSWQEHVMTRSQSVKVSCKVRVSWSSKNQGQDFPSHWTPYSPTIEEWQWFSIPRFSECCQSQIQLADSNICVCEYAQTSTQSPDWLFNAQVEPLHFFIICLKTPGHFSHIQWSYDLWWFKFHSKHPDNTNAQTFFNILNFNGFNSFPNQPTHIQREGFDVRASAKNVYFYIFKTAFLITKCFFEVVKCLSHLPSTNSSKLNIGIFNTEKFILELKLLPISVSTSLDENSASLLHNFFLSGILKKLFS